MSQDECQVVVSLKCEEMVFAEDAAADLERLAVKRFGVRVFALIGKTNSQIVVDEGHRLVVVAVEPPLDRQCLLILSLGLGEFGLPIQDASQVAVSRACPLRDFVALEALENLNGFAVPGF